MNCKAGDLVVCLRSEVYPEFVGRIFTVTKVNAEVSAIIGRIYWRTHPIQLTPRGRVCFFADYTLKPIRPPRQTDDVTASSDAGVTA